MSRRPTEGDNTHGEDADAFNRRSDRRVFPNQGGGGMTNIDGTWRFVRATARDDAGNARPAPFDGQSMGRIVIGGGRLAVMMIDWRPDVPAGQKREYSGYTG